MSHVTPNTTSAAAKLLRGLTSALDTATATSAPREAFCAATAASSEPLLTTLTKQLTPSTAPAQLNAALYTLFNLSNTLSPAHLAPHWRTLCQKVLTVSKHAPHPRTLLSLAALALASSPISALGAEHRAVVAAIAQHALRHAATTLSEFPAHSLCVILAVVHSSPRELRAQALDDRLLALLSHPQPAVRALAAAVSAALVTCLPEKVREKRFFERVAYVQAQVADITVLLDAFTTGRYNGDMADRTAREVRDHLDGVCKLLVRLLDLPIRAPFPLASILKMLCDGVRERVIDPYAAVEAVRVTHDDLLIVIPHVQRLCGQAIADVAERVHKVALQMYTKGIGKVFEMRLSKLLLRSREDSLTCIVERGDIYATVGRLITALGTGFLDFVVPRFQELFEIDVALRKMCLAGGNIQTVDPVSNIPTGGRSRKRRRHNGRRDALVGSQILTKESVQDLASVYGKETSRFVESTIDVALDVIARMFDCRGLLTKSVIKRLQKLEDQLLDIFLGNRLSPVLLRAVTSAALSGGSKRMTSEASPLLMPLARVSVRAALDTRLSSETRDMALAARAGCEAIIHPRGPPYAMECRMYPTMVGKERSSVEKRVAKKDFRSLGKPHSEQNGSLSDQGDGVIVDAKRTVAEGQHLTQSEEAGEENGKNIMDETPSNNLMEVDDEAEIPPISTEAREDLPQPAMNVGNAMIETVPTKGAEGGKPPVDGNVRRGDELHRPTPLADKPRVEEHRTEQAAHREPAQLLEKNVESTKECPKEPSDDSVGTDRAEMANEREGAKDERDGDTAPDAHERADREGLEGGDEQDSEKEDQALIDGLVFESSDEE